MWWLLVFFLVLGIIVVLKWPLSIKVTFQTDSFGSYWHLKTKTPFKLFEIKYRNGQFETNKDIFKFKKALAYTKKMYVKKSITSKSTQNNLWQEAFIDSLKLKNVDFRMGLKGVVSGEAAFLFGVFLAIIYPAFGYFHDKNKNFLPKVVFDKELRGFYLNCIITFSLGQLITEAGKRYWALWKESI